MEKFENTNVVTVMAQVATVRYAINENGECVVHSHQFFGMSAKKAAALIKKEYKGKVIILEKTYDIIHYDVVGGTFIPLEEPEEPEETEE